MNRAIAITGCGLVTPLGNNVDETWSALLAGRFIRTHSRCDVPSIGPLNRTAALGLMAANESLKEARWGDQISDERTALIVGTSKGPIEDWITAPLPQSHKPLSTEPWISDFGLAGIATTLSDKLGFGSGPRETLSAACASGLHAMIRACLMIESGEADRALVVATESSIHPLFLGGFDRLGVLPADEIGCRPFDQDRAGFLMSESAAAVCVEGIERPTDRIRVDRTRLGGDPTSITGADPQGQTLKRLLTDVISRRPIDLVHAHGTGTVLNDPIELAAIESVLPRNADVHLYSHKGALGHSLGTSGLISVVLNTQMHQRSMILPNVQTRRPLAANTIKLARDGVDRHVRSSIVIAAGFGGSIAVVRLVS